ncbi:uncharacterized protein LOC124551077 isoform X6 [Schistocerca americana]|uniref:uncharacterized protein LOC124551077 isoform X6 n=1 Tax=Schistocerca americana TaxID=7009 RepID=UPI001F4FF9C5|nr:uncharacterized protein LOC124551077 isoform X6 [Schistocerca americana]
MVEASPLSFLKQEIVHMSVKQETPVEADPLAFPKQEIEYIPIKEETPEWDMPDDHYSIHDPLSITKEECSSSEDFLSSRALSIKEEEDRKYKDTMREDDFQVCLDNDGMGSRPWHYSRNYCGVCVK